MMREGRSLRDRHCAFADAAAMPENGPDLEFAKPFFWQPKQTKIKVEFWVDEAVHKYWISDVAACPCRSN